MKSFLPTIVGPRRGTGPVWPVLDLSGMKVRVKELRPVQYSEKGITYHR